MYKNRTNLKLILSVLIMLLSFATLVFFWKIIENKNVHTSKVLATLEDKIVKKSDASDLTKKVSEIDQLKVETKKHFVDSKSIDSFIGYLESLGADANTEVKVEGFDPMSTTKDHLTVRLSAKGTFSNIMRTIMLLENSPYQVHIKKTYINKGSPAVSLDEKGNAKYTQTNTWQLDVTFSVLMSN
jgi:hypothetical protein